jgi:PKD repeat protein
VEELAWVDIDGDGVEQMKDNFVADGRRLLYISHHPLYSIDSVLVDGTRLADNQYCFDLIAGWVSLSTTPADSAIVYYQYSFKNDLTYANWDTFNMAHANLNRPIVDFEADTIFGWAPLAVQFADSTVGASSWLWSFGDGDTSSLASPSHTYEQSGAFDVSLEVERPDGPHNHTNRRMIVILGDTITFPNVNYLSDDTIVIPICLANSQPLSEFTIPFSFSGETDLGYAGFNTNSCRTDYFDEVRLTAFSSTGSRIAFTFTAAGTLSDNPPLAPGYGPVINVRFTVSDGSGFNTIDTTSTTMTSLGCDAGYVQYVPVVVPGHLNVGLCGDVDGDGRGPNLADITRLIAYVYLHGPEPWNLDAANGYDPDNDKINLADITGLIAYVYLRGPEPDCH